ncbi:MAG: hypothetical protein RL186_1056 [Pseudomonadota bacterium]
MSADVVLVIVASFGTLALVATAFVLGLAKTETLTSVAQVRAALEGYDPDATATDIAIADDGKAALAVDAAQKLYLLRVMGDSIAIRTLTHTQLRALSPQTVAVRCKDLGFPDFDFHSDYSNLQAIVGAGAPCEAAISGENRHAAS